MSSYQMKKALRKTAGLKSYAELQEENDLYAFQQDIIERQKEMQKESIFQNKNWSLKEKIKLMIFLSYYHGLPQWSSERKSIYLYKYLSTFLKQSRTPEQCKNIHTLFKRKFKDLEAVLRVIMYELSVESSYQKLVVKYQKQIENFQSEHNLLDSIERESYRPLFESYLVQKKFKKAVQNYSSSDYKIDLNSGLNLNVNNSNVKNNYFNATVNNHNTLNNLNNNLINDTNQNNTQNINLINHLSNNQNNQNNRHLNLFNHTPFYQDDLKFNLTEYINIRPEQRRMQTHNNHINDGNCNEAREVGRRNRRQELVELMRYHFEEWVSCMTVVEQANLKNNQNQNNNNQNNNHNVKNNNFSNKLQ